MVLADGAQERVTFSEELEPGVVRTITEMRRILATGSRPDLGEPLRNNVGPAAIVTCVGIADMSTRLLWPTSRMSAWNWGAYW